MALGAQKKRQIWRKWQIHQEGDDLANVVDLAKIILP